jgi:hypothetical protein
MWRARCGWTIEQDSRAPIEMELQDVDVVAGSCSRRDTWLHCSCPGSPRCARPTTDLAAAQAPIVNPISIIGGGGHDSDSHDANNGPTPPSSRSFAREQRDEQPTGARRDDD